MEGNTSNLSLELAVETTGEDEVVYLVPPADQSCNWTLCGPPDAECRICTPYGD